MTNYGFKKLLLILAGGFVLFWLIKPSDSKGKKIVDNGKEKDPAALRKNATIALKAYGNALKANAGAEELAELNRTLQDEYGIRVYRKQSDGRYYAADTAGNDIIKV